MMVLKKVEDLVPRMAEWSAEMMVPSTDSLTAVETGVRLVSWKGLQTAGNSAKTWGSLQEVQWEYQMVAKLVEQTERPRADTRAVWMGMHSVHWSVEW